MNLDAVLPKGTKLENKRSHRQVSIVDIFTNLSAKTDWQVVIEYRLYDGKRFTYIMETELDKWQVIKC